VEATRALERHACSEAKVIPIIARPCHWEDAPFAELQALPSGAKPVTTWSDNDEAWEDVVRGLRAAIEALGKAPSTDPRYADDESRQLSLRRPPIEPKPASTQDPGDATPASPPPILPWPVSTPSSAATTPASPPLPSGPGLRWPRHRCRGRR
jgi:hypothetical protein